MDFQTKRLRGGEFLAGTASLALLLCLLLVPWYGLTEPAQQFEKSLAMRATATRTGWQALTDLRWLILVTALSGLALFLFQATRWAPALPSSLSVIATVLGAITTVALVWRVLISVPGTDPMVVSRSGADLGLVFALALTAGGLWSLREEDPPDLIRNEAIPVIPIR